MSVQPTCSLVLRVQAHFPGWRSSVLRALEWLGETSTRFELILAIDSSHDDLLDTGHDLARRFPQVRVLTIDGNLSSAELRDSLRYYACGEMLLLAELNAAFSPLSLGLHYAHCRSDAVEEPAFVRRRLRRRRQALV